MGKSLPCTAKLQEGVKIVASHKGVRPKNANLTSKNRLSFLERRPSGIRIDLGWGKGGEMDKLGGGENRMPLSQVVSELVKSWFRDALEGAKAGDISMQVLVGQMYCSGYGVAKDVQQGRAWLGKAAQSRSSAWKVGDKHPGYNASDSDSDELKTDTK